jgi:hypothetical protein
MSPTGSHTTQLELRQIGGYSTRNEGPELAWAERAARGQADRTVRQRVDYPAEEHFRRREDP